MPASLRRWSRPRQLSAAAVAAGLALFAASPAVAGADRVRVEGALYPYSSAVPAGATARVQTVANAAGDTIVTLHVRGLKPDTEYGAHAHQNPCGLEAADAGGHFQLQVDPRQPSTDPAYANSENEIWLDFETDGAGNGVAQTKVAWQFPPDRRARSVIIHQERTQTGYYGGTAGSAGPRLACLTVGF